VRRGLGVLARDEFVGERVDAGLQEGPAHLGDLVRGHQRAGLDVLRALLQVAELDEAHDADQQGDETGDPDGGEDFDAQRQREEPRRQGQTHGWVPFQRTGNDALDSAAPQIHSS
jgi:hypothetical protein